MGVCDTSLCMYILVSFDIFHTELQGRAVLAARDQRATAFVTGLFSQKSPVYVGLF